jgi:hypothetical protein
LRIQNQEIRDKREGGDLRKEVGEKR